MTIFSAAPLIAAAAADAVPARRTIADCGIDCQNVNMCDLPSIELTGVAVATSART